MGVDGSAASVAAVAWATRDAAMRNLSLTLVHVVTPVVPTAAPWPEIPVGNDFFRWQDEEAMRVPRSSPQNRRGLLS